MPRTWYLVLIGMLGAAFWAIAAQQDELRSAAVLLPVNFAHTDHRDVNCIDCHHDYADSTPIGMCLDCHKRDPEVSHLVEAQFHDLCRTCHIDEALAGEEHGPTRHCEACHQPDPHP